MGITAVAFSLWKDVQQWDNDNHELIDICSVKEVEDRRHVISRKTLAILKVKNWKQSAF